MLLQSLPAGSASTMQAQAPRTGNEPVPRSMLHSNLPAIDLPIANIAQENSLWCWAAVVQQVALSSNGVAPKQCEIVALAAGQPATSCCEECKTKCDTPGSLPVIIDLIALLTGRSSALSRHVSAGHFYNLLRSGRPLILQLNDGNDEISHVVLLRGMSFAYCDGARLPVLHINDPYNHQTSLVPYWKISCLCVGTVVIN